MHAYPCVPYYYAEYTLTVLLTSNPLVIDFMNDIQILYRVIQEEGVSFEICTLYSASARSTRQTPEVVPHASTQS